MRHMPRILFLLLPVVALGAACADEPESKQRVTADQDRTKVETEIAETYDAFSRALARADVQLLLDSVYGDSAFHLLPGSPAHRAEDAFHGRVPFLDTLADEVGPGLDISFEVVDRDYSGDLAYDLGTYTLTGPDQPGDPTLNHGRFLIIWKRGEDGRWRIQANAFSPAE